MSDIKRDVRDLEDDTKEAWRKADGEDLGDKMANAGDRIRHGVENLGDEVHEKVDEAGRKVEYEHGRMDEAARKSRDGEYDR